MVGGNRAARLARLGAGSDAAPGTASHLLLLLIAASVLALLLWARLARLDEVTRGPGEVIPSGRVQVVQNLEGGLVAAILVREGESVAAGQPLLRLENLRAASDYREKQARYLGLLAARARLEAEIGGHPPAFPPEIPAGTAASEAALLRARAAQQDAQTAILRQQARQRAQELAELKGRLGQAARSSKLAQEELALAETVAGTGAIPRGDLLKLQRQASDAKGALDQTRLSLPRAETALAEARGRVEAAGAGFRAAAQDELSRTLGELAGLGEIVAEGEDRVRRAEVRSPVRGIVKSLRLTTLGGVAQPGQELAEIVPLEDTLLVEARIRPADIGFIHPGQPATVKLTAYDFSIYGGLEGTVEEISPDTLDDECGQGFYRLRVRTLRSHLGSEADPLPIIPGMTAEVDVLTGRKSVLDYLLKPILKARAEALRER